jgi:hypothetical protein
MKYLVLLLLLPVAIFAADCSKPKIKCDPAPVKCTKEVTKCDAKREDTRECDTKREAKCDPKREDTRDTKPIGTGNCNEKNPHQNLNDHNDDGHCDNGEKPIKKEGGNCSTPVVVTTPNPVVTVVEPVAPVVEPVAPMVEMVVFEPVVVADPVPVVIEPIITVLDVVVQSTDGCGSRGTSLGKIRNGTVLTMQYVNGAWTAYPYEPLKNPDIPESNSTNNCPTPSVCGRLNGINKQLIRVGTGTAAQPWSFTVEGDYDEVIMNMESDSKPDNNLGSVDYSVMITELVVVSGNG